jgi:two-component system response regulator GlrR
MKRLRTAQRRILVVDDDPIVLEVVRARLEAAGHEVHTRENAIGTTQWVATHRPDFVLLDISMPAISGSELLLLLKKRDATSGAGVIFYSGLPPEQLANVVRDSGALGAISKSADEVSFLDELERIMAKGPSLRPPPAP